MVTHAQMPPQKPSNKKKVCIFSSSISMRCPYHPPPKKKPLVPVFFKAPNRELMARARGYLELEMLMFFCCFENQWRIWYVWNVTSLDTCYVPSKRCDVLKIFFFQFIVLFFFARSIDERPRFWHFLWLFRRQNDWLLAANGCLTNFSVSNQ